MTGILNELRLILTYRILGLALTVAPKGTQEGRDIVNALAAVPMRKPL